MAALTDLTLAQLSTALAKKETSAVEVADGKTTNYFLTTFGRVDRETICAREEGGPTLSHALHDLAMCGCHRPQGDGERSR